MASASAGHRPGCRKYRCRKVEEIAASCAEINAAPRRHNKRQDFVRGSRRKGRKPPRVKRGERAQPWRGLEPALDLVDDIDPALATDQAIAAMAAAKGLQGVAYFHSSGSCGARPWRTVFYKIARKTRDCGGRLVNRRSACAPTHRPSPDHWLARRQGLRRACTARRGRQLQEPRRGWRRRFASRSASGRSRSLISLIARGLSEVSGGASLPYTTRSGPIQFEHHFHCRQNCR